MLAWPNLIWPTLNWHSKEPGCPQMHNDQKQLCSAGFWGQLRDVLLIKLYYWFMVDCWKLVSRSHLLRYATNWFIFSSKLLYTGCWEAIVDNNYCGELALRPFRTSAGDLNLQRPLTVQVSDSDDSACFIVQITIILKFFNCLFKCIGKQISGTWLKQRALSGGVYRLANREL